MKNDLDIKLIVGHILYENIETGYWALFDGTNKFRIKNIPDELKKENIKIAAVVKESDNEMSIFMSGKLIELIEYKLIK